MHAPEERDAVHERPVRRRGRQGPRGLRRGRHGRASDAGSAQAPDLRTTGVEHRLQLLKTKQYEGIRAKLLHERDIEVASYLRDHVPTPEFFATMRLVINISKRESEMLQQVFKYTHFTDGTKKRRMLATDSTVELPPIFTHQALTKNT